MSWHDIVDERVGSRPVRFLRQLHIAKTSPCDYLDSPLTMDSMNRAFVAWRSALSASTSFRSLASISEFQFAKPTPAPVQKTCCQGSVRWGGWGVSDFLK